MLYSKRQPVSTNKLFPLFLLTGVLVQLSEHNWFEITTGSKSGSKPESWRYGGYPQDSGFEPDIFHNANLLRSRLWLFEMKLRIHFFPFHFDSFLTRVGSSSMKSAAEYSLTVSGICISVSTKVSFVGGGPERSSRSLPVTCHPLDVLDFFC